MLLKNPKYNVLKDNSRIHLFFFFETFLRLLQVHEPHNSYIKYLLSCESNTIIVKPFLGSLPEDTSAASSAWSTFFVDRSLSFLDRFLHAKNI